MKKHHFVTIRDIAKELDISVATVSRALRDTFDVSQDTRRKVLAKVNELNYKPNFNAIGLVNGSSHNIGVVLPHITSYYFATVITGIQEVAYSKGYNIVFFVTNDSPDREISVIQNLPISNLDGLLVCISSNPDSYKHFQQVIDEGIPIVFFDRVATDIDTSKVMQDDYNGAFEVVEHLIRNGYSKIAHIAGSKDLLLTKQRLNGYLAALEKHNIPVREEWIIYSSFSQQCGETDTYLLLKCKETPDAIFAVNDRKAIGAIIALKSKNIRIGKEVGVVGFTNDPVSTIISPTLTTMAEPALDIGKKSCELLFKHIKKKNFQPEEVILPGKLIVRESSIK